MQKLDLHIVSIPDYKAQTAIAQLIVSANRSIPMQTAMDMVRNPPLQLCRNLDLGEAEKYKDKLNRLGVGFHFSPVYDAQQPAAPAPAPAAANSALSEFADIKAHNENIANNADAETDAEARAIAAAKAKGAKEAAGARTPFSGAGYSSSGGGHGHGSPAGVRIGSLGGDHGGNHGGDLNTLRAQEKKAKRNSLIFTSISAVVMCIVAVLLITSGNGPKKKFGPDKEQAKAAADALRAGANQTQQPSAPTGGAAKQQPAAAAADSGNTFEKQRSRVNSQQKQQANNYIDSARAASAEDPNLDKIIAFYRIAISFNRYNLAAWQGLLQAYRDKGMAKEAREAEEQMQALFGDKVSSVSNLVKQFGDLVDTYTGDDGTYRVEYRSQKRTRADILNEVFNMTRSVRAACACEKVYIFASTGAGRGLIAQSNASTSVHTLAAFQAQAEIIWVPEP